MEVGTQDAGVSTSPAQAAGPPAAPATGTPDQVIRRYHFAGEALIARGDRVLLHRAYGTIAPSGGAPHRVGERWRLASITKQVTAALVVRDLSRNTRYRGVPHPLDIPVIEVDGRGVVTTRQYLSHHTGLANPDETPATSSGVPAFYTRTRPDLDYCRSRPATPGAPFSYNNCDYLILGEMRGLPGRQGVGWPTGMAMARVDEVGIPGFVRGRPEPRFQLASWGAAGGLIGTADAVFRFDRSLMTGRLLPPAALAELWRPEGHGSYQALGAWVFPGQLRGCAAPKRIVQRDGEIYGVQARNFILPDDGISVIVFTNRSSDDFAFGEVWQRAGFAYDLLSAVACSA